MKKHIPGIIFVLLSFIANAGIDSDKYALIIAIGNYNQELTGWYPINTKNDISLIEKTLLSLGYKEENIMYLYDSLATKQGIEQALKDLFTKVSEGDQVVIHYSGHGQQIFDDNGDEIDGLDEALVCYDAPMKMYSGYDGKKHFRDDELGNWIMKFRIKLGKNGHLVLFLDSCHSGTGTRGSAKVRGGAPALVPDGWKTNVSNKDNKVGFGIEANHSENQSREITKDNLAKFVVFSGASANELNYETYDDENNTVGSLSYCIYKAFSNIKTQETYRQVFARVLSEMSTKAPNQNPAIEGDIDYVVFGGDFQTPSKYFTIKSAKNDSIVEINAGNLAGINPGSVIAFSKPGSLQPEDDNIIVKGKVISSTNFFSTVLLEKKYKFNSSSAAWVFVISKSLSPNRVKVLIDPRTDSEIKNSLPQQINSLGYAEISDNNPEITISLSQTRGAKTIILQNSYYNKEIQKISANDNQTLIKEVISTIQNYSQGKIIKEMDFYDERYDINMELIPVKAKINDDGSFQILEYLPNSSIFDDTGSPAFSTKDYAVIKVKNNGTKKAWFNIIDIQPDGFINPVIPTVEDIDGREYFLDPGDSAIIKNTLVMFYGNEIFKLISSNKPMNITSQITKRGNSTRGDIGNIFENLIFTTSNSTTRGASTVSQSSNSEKISTFEYSFKIKE